MAERENFDDSANSPTPSSDFSAFVYGSQSFPPIPVRDEDFKGTRLLFEKSPYPCLTL